MVDLRRFLGGGAFFLLGIGVCIGSYRLGLGGFHKPGTGLVPFLAGSIMAFLSVPDMIGAVLSKKREAKKLASLWEGLYWRRAASILLITALYASLLNYTGFLIITPFYIPFCMRVLGYRKWFILGVAALFSTLAFYLLTYLFTLSIPSLPEFGD